MRGQNFGKMVSWGRQKMYAALALINLAGSDPVMTITVLADVQLTLTLNLGLFWLTFCACSFPTRASNWCTWCIHRASSKSWPGHGHSSLRILTCSPPAMMTPSSARCVPCTCGALCIRNIHCHEPLLVAGCHQNFLCMRYFRRHDYCRVYTLQLRFVLANLLPLCFPSSSILRTVLLLIALGFLLETGTTLSEFL